MRRDTPEYVKRISKELRKNETEAEAKLWQRIRGNKLAGYKFKRQYCLGRYIADFYCSEALLIIEVDGKIHSYKDQIEYDVLREKELKSRNIKVLRFTNEQVLGNIKSVLDSIYKVLKEEKLLQSNPDSITQAPLS